VLLTAHRVVGNGVFDGPDLYAKVFESLQRHRVKADII
jgi:hypothetical protein